MLVKYIKILIFSSKADPLWLPDHIPEIFTDLRDVDVDLRDEQTFLVSKSLRQVKVTIIIHDELESDNIIHVNHCDSRIQL